MRLPESFYLDDDVVAISRALLGKYLVTAIGGVVTSGKIVETEAYRAPEDRASHAYGNRRTARTETLFCCGGVCYIYLCYGIHHLFNVVTGPAETPHAVLIRALEPADGLQSILSRRKMSALNSRVSAGPGTLTQALGLTTEHNGSSLQGPAVWIENRGDLVQQHEIIAKPRVGVDYAGEDAKLPWRFLIDAN